jgi:hypothetical protein
MNLKTIQTGDHILGMYNNTTILNHALSFLKTGFEKNELVLLLTDSPKNIIEEKIRDSWNVDSTESLEGQNILIKSAKEWYFPDNIVNVKKIQNQWKKWVKLSEEIGLKGVRVFADVSSFFKYGFTNELFHYESSLDRKFSIPLTAICAYTYDDLEHISENMIDELKQHHGKIWSENEDIEKKIRDAVKKDKGHTEKLSSA